MILNGHYLAVTKLSALLRGITSKHQRYFYCLNCLHFATQNQLESHESECKSKDFCGIVLTTQKNDILHFNRYMILDKISYIINVDVESLIKKNR